MTSVIPVAEPQAATIFDLGSVARYLATGARAFEIVAAESLETENLRAASFPVGIHAGEGVVRSGLPISRLADRAVRQARRRGLSPAVEADLSKLLARLRSNRTKN